MDLLKECKAYFESKGYEIKQIENSFLICKIGGLTYLVFSNKNDKDFMKVDLRFGIEGLSFSRLALLEAANALNEKRKVVKVHLEDSDAAVFTAENLLDSTPNPIDLLDRLLKMLKEAYDYFVAYLEIRYR